MVIEQGDVFWIEFNEPYGVDPGFRRPYVVVQNNMFNFSRIDSVVVCAITSNLELAQAPGNVRLDRGEANLARPSVVNISQLFTVDKRDLVERVGTLSARRIQAIIAGLYLLLEPTDF